MTHSLTPLADAVLSLLRGEDEPVDPHELWGCLTRLKRAGAFPDLDSDVGFRAVRGALGSLESAGLAVHDAAGCWSAVKVILAAVVERQGSLWG